MTGEVGNIGAFATYVVTFAVAALESITLPVWITIGAIAVIGTIGVVYFNVNRISTSTSYTPTGNYCRIQPPPTGSQGSDENLRIREKATAENAASEEGSAMLLRDYCRHQNQPNSFWNYLKSLFKVGSKGGSSGQPGGQPGGSSGQSGGFNRLGNLSNPEAEVSSTTFLTGSVSTEIYGSDHTPSVFAYNNPGIVMSLEELQHYQNAMQDVRYNGVDIVISNDIIAVLPGGGYESYLDDLFASFPHKTLFDAFIDWMGWC